MARLLKETDIKPALKLATSSTKDLVIAGVNGDHDFPKLLAKYTWTGTRDYNMALIIVAFYTYCTKSDNSDLKKFGRSALQEGSDSSKLFEYLGEGNGKKVKDCMKTPFMTALGTVLKIALPDPDDENKRKNEDKRGKIIKSFINQAGKITPWKINKNDVSDILDKLIGKISKPGNEKLENMKKERYDELKNIKLDQPKKHSAQLAFVKKQLLEAIMSNDLSSLEEIIKNYPEFLNSKISNNNGDTPLHLAVKNDKIDIVELLLEKGADPNIKNNAGNTPLIVAAAKGDKEIAELLLKYKADPNIKNNNGTTPLHWAADKGDKEIAELLLKYKADPNIKENVGATPLYWAVENNKIEIVKLLLEKGADPNIKDADGETPLRLAMKNNKIEIVKLLLEKGADPNIKNNNGTTPLIVAAAKGDKEIAELLLKYKADPNIKNNNGFTPLHWAAAKGDKEIVELLLKHGAKTDIKDNQGKTPLDYAANAEIRNLLTARSNNTASFEGNDFCKAFQSKLDELIKTNDGSESGTDKLMAICVSFTKYDITTSLRKNPDFVKNVLARSGPLTNKTYAKMVKEQSGFLTYQNTIQRIYNYLNALNKDDDTAGI